MLWIVIVMTPSCVGDEKDRYPGLAIVDGSPKNILALFPLDTESVSVANGPFVFQSSAFDDDRKGNGVDNLAVLQHIPISELIGLRGTELLDGVHVEMVVEGARRFRAPQGVGMARFEGCQLLRVADTKAADVAKLDQLIERISGETDQQLRVMDHNILRISESARPENVETLIVRLSRREIVVATDQNFLEDVLVRYKVLNDGGRRKHDALSGFPGWKHISDDAVFWAVRRYDVGAALDDPTSAIGLHESATVRDRDAIGVTVCFEARKTSRLRLHYLTNSRDAQIAASKLWTTFGFMSEKLPMVVSEFESGTARMEADFKGEGSQQLLSEWAHGIMVLMGHAPYP